MAKLSVSREEAAVVLDEQAQAGDQLLARARSVSDPAEYDEWKYARRRWAKFTTDALNHAYADTEAADEFNKAMARMAFSATGRWQDYIREGYQDVQDGVNALHSLKERLRFATEPADVEQPSRAVQPDGPDAIFIVHGRDEGRREQVARFLERAGDHQYEPVILDEQASRGRTLIEKFEEHATTAKYAVVLLTGDDIGGLKGGDQKPRARQNVVFELGFFFGVLGRDRVAVLYEPDVEKPSDVDGLAYIPLNGDWRQRLARELRAAGLDFSLDRL